MTELGAPHAHVEGKFFGENVINNSFIPKCIGHLASPTLREVFALPTRAGGLGLENPTKTATAAYEASNKITQELKRAILTQNIDFSEFDEEKEKEAKKQYQKEKQEKEKENVERVKAIIRGATAENNNNINEAKPKKKKEHDPPLLRALEIAADKGASNWLTSLPLERYNFALARCCWTSPLPSSSKKLPLHMRMWSPQFSHSCPKLSSWRVSWTKT